MRSRTVQGRQRREAPFPCPDDSLCEVREARKALKVKRTRLRERERVLSQERRETSLPHLTLVGKEVSTATEDAVLSEGVRRRSRSGSRSGLVLREARGQGAGPGLSRLVAWAGIHLGMFSAKVFCAVVGPSPTCSSRTSSPYVLSFEQGEGVAMSFVEVVLSSIGLRSVAQAG